MLRNHWYIICDSKRLKKKPVGMTRLGRRIVLWRDRNGAPAALADQCVHRGASLCGGRVVADSIQCPFHGFEYDRTGKCVLVPAMGRAAEVPAHIRGEAVAVREEHGYIWLFNGAADQATERLPFFKNIDRSFSYLSSETPLGVHYTRAIENQLDVFHLPFVHRTTIGHGGAVMAQPQIVVEDDGLKVWVTLEKDHGQPLAELSALGATDEKKQHLHFRFPGIWQNYITEKMRIFISFTPVDDDNTLIFMRTYQKMLTVPLLRSFVDLPLMWLSNIILAQDNRVVRNQLPIRSELRMDEKLIRADLPIVKYREIRDRLKNR